MFAYVIAVGALLATVGRFGCVFDMVPFVVLSVLTSFCLQEAAVLDSLSLWIAFIFFIGFTEVGYRLAVSICFTVPCCGFTFGYSCGDSCQQAVI